MLSKWQELIVLYLEGTSGSLLGGIVHNLNNYVHSFRLQSELFAQKIEKGKIDDPEQCKVLAQRISHGASELADFSHTLERRTYFLNPDLLEINVKDFFDWLAAYWINHLFFKHKIELNLFIDEQLPYFIQVPGQAFTFCLEEGLKNAITACLAKSKQDEGGKDFCLELQARTKEPAQVEFSLVSPTTLPENLDPWAEGSTTQTGRLGLGLPLVNLTCQKLNWNCSLQSNGQKTVYTLLITSPTVKN